MRYSRERQASLSERIVAALRADDQVHWEDDPETVRRRLNRLFAAVETAHGELVARAEAKLSQMKRRIPPGSAEWDLLVRRYLGEEYEKIDHFSLDK